MTLKRTLQQFRALQKSFENALKILVSQRGGLKSTKLEVRHAEWPHDDVAGVEFLEEKFETTQWRNTLSGGQSWEVRHADLMMTFLGVQFPPPPLHPRYQHRLDQLDRRDHKNPNHNQKCAQKSGQVWSFTKQDNNYDHGLPEQSGPSTWSSLW